MIETNFYRIELNSEKIEISYAEIHNIRKDILIYYDDNFDEVINILISEENFRNEYWKFVSINFKTEFGESIKYKKLIEEGSLVLINGIILEILDEPIVNIKNTWNKTPIKEILLYLKQYNPTTEKLKIAKTYLMNGLTFIDQFKNDDMDKDGFLKQSNVIDMANWFNKEIIQAYYKWSINGGL